MVMLSALTSLLCVGVSMADPKPHVLLVLADDYGHGGLGVHRKADISGTSEAKQALAETHTANLDVLIAEGIKLERHYTYKICGPSRASLQSGRLAVHVNAVNTGPLVHNPADPVSGFAGIPRNMTGLATKLRSGGYRTHMVGKWDAGMATPDHTPLGRGYESWLGYYQHANHYWRKTTSFESTGEVDQCLDRMHDFAFMNETYRGHVLDAASLSDACQADREGDPACYEEHLFKQRGLEIIREHDVSEPLFLFYAFHLLHTPMQVPLSYLDRIDRLVAEAGGEPFDSMNRRLYAAMTVYMDEVVGELVSALKSKDMWENTLLIFMADNGGAVYEPAASNNHPLKGAKYSDFEGGVRGIAFASGGFVPSEKRGTRFDGVVSIADWYGTLCEIAGVHMEDERAEQANGWLVENGLPTLKPVDSVAQWSFILNGTNGRRDALHLSDQALLRWPFKLVIGGHPYAQRTGALFPNCSTVAGFHQDQGPLPVDMKLFNAKLNLARRESKHDDIYWWQDCGENGCLYNLDVDPLEQHDLAEDFSSAEIRKDLRADLFRRNEDLFTPERGEATAVACKTAMAHDGFMGPFVDAEEWYTPMPSPPPSMGKLAEGLLYDVLGARAVKRFSEKVVEVGVAVGFRPIVTKVWQLDKCIRPSDSLVV